MCSSGWKNMIELQEILLFVKFVLGAPHSNYRYWYSVLIGNQSRWKIVCSYVFLHLCPASVHWRKKKTQIKMQQQNDGSHSETREPLEDMNKKANNNNDILTPNHWIGLEKERKKKNTNCCSWAHTKRLMALCGVKFNIYSWISTNTQRKRYTATWSSQPSRWWRRVPGRRAREIGSGNTEKWSD